MGKPPRGRGTPRGKKKNPRKEPVTVTGRIGKPQKSRKNKKLKKWNENLMGEGGTNRSDISRNFKPKDDDIQEIPWKVKNLMRNKNKYKQLVHANRPESMKIMGIAKADTVGAKRPVKQVPVFEQRETETDETFMKRVDRETKEELEMFKFEQKMNRHNQKNEVDSILAEKSEEKKQENKKRKKKDKEIQRLKAYREQKAEKKKEEEIVNTQISFDKLQDKILFGEVAMQPPTLTAKPRKAADIEKGRPGKKSLLLKEIISDNATHSVNAKKSKRDVGKSVKRKTLSPAQQLIMDSERKRVIDLYRSMRGKKDIIFDK